MVIPQLQFGAKIYQIGVFGIASVDGADRYAMKSLKPGGTTVRLSLVLATAMLAVAGGLARAEELRIALIYGKTGPLEAYAKQTENGLFMGLE